jgi:hypothetical protein
MLPQCFRAFAGLLNRALQCTALGAEAAPHVPGGGKRLFRNRNNAQLDQEARLVRGRGNKSERLIVRAEKQVNPEISGGLFFHELANALQIVMGQCLLLQFDETVSPSVRERLNAIEMAVERINASIRQQPRR